MRDATDLLAENASLRERLRLDRLAELTPSILAGLAYALSFLLMEWVSTAQAEVPGIYRWYLPAGLSLGFLTLFGRRLLPLVFLVHLISGVWITRPEAGVVFQITFALLLSGMYFLAAILLSKTGFKRAESLEEVTKFASIGLLASVGVSFLQVAGAAFSAPEASDLIGTIFRLDLQSTFLGILSVGLFLLRPALPDSGRGWRVMERLGMTGWYDFLVLPAAALIPAVLALFKFPEIGLPFWLFFLFLFSFSLGGLSRFSNALLALIGSLIVASQFLGLMLPDISDLECLLAVAAIPTLFISVIVDRRNAAQIKVRSQAAAIESINLAARQLLGRDQWEEGTAATLKGLAETLGVSNVYIIEKPIVEGESTPSPPAYEWRSENCEVQTDHIALFRAMQSDLVSRHTQTLAGGEAVCLYAREMPDKEREIFSALGIKSSIILPMFVDRNWTGCLGLDQCRSERRWIRDEIEALKTVARMIGVLLGRARIEHRFRHITGNIQVGFWISPADVRDKIYVSPGFRDLWGGHDDQSDQSRMWLENIHYEDRERLDRILADPQAGEYDQEYRLILPDRSIRWVRDRGYPVRDESGRIYRFVGIAEDVTRQKDSEEKLRAATRFLSALVDNLDWGILVVDRQRKVTHLNQSFCKLFGIDSPPESLVGIDSRLLLTRSVSREIEVLVRQDTSLAEKEVFLEDGRFFRCRCRLLSVDDRRQLHLWQFRDVTDWKTVEEKIKASLQEKDVLLKEIHHRVKNNLQVISSLLSLQSSTSKEPAVTQTIQESQNRLKAMALVHERLYQSSDLAKIDFAGYIRSLVDYLLKSYTTTNGSIRVRTDVLPVAVDLDVAIPCALVINELVSNALKYAFPGDGGGEIRIELRQDGVDSLQMVVSDNGVGFPFPVNPEKTGSLGLKLVHNLVNQLEGKVTCQSEKGTKFDIRFPCAC